ncbi:DUF262 domain-containing protein [Campylobacter jejuni]|nr:DUF262 domain-containing protein [Campylobacter jejuni]
MEIKANISSLEDILADNRKFYQIPDYQRPYSWDKENLSDLIDDLFNAYTNNKNENYFCGSLVLVNNEKDQRFDIIDGQQRMTTFIILSCVFKALYWEQINDKAKDFILKSIQDRYEETKRKLRFLTNEYNQNGFEQNILQGIKFEEFKNIKKIENDLKNDKYIINAYYFKSLLQNKLNEYKEIKINDFIIWIYEKVVLTVIICPSQDSAIKIFNVLNDRGMPLSPVDILKSSLMYELDNEDRKIFKATWNSINDNIKNNGLELFSLLNTYLYYTITSNPKTRLDKELLDNFKKNNKNSLEIINDIQKFSKSYIDLLKMEDKYIYLLRYLRHEIYWTSILTTALFNNYEYFDELKKLLLSYYYKNWIAGNTIATIKQTSFRILKLVKEKSNIQEIKNEILENIKNNNMEENYIENLEYYYVYGKKWDKPILLMLEYFATDNNHHSFIPLDANIQIEHILPIKYKEYNWDKIFTEDEREKWTNSLANLTLISMRKNVQALNYDFARKKEIYANKDKVKTCYTITQDVIHNYNEWDVNSLKRRKKELIEKITNILSF